MIFSIFILPHSKCPVAIMLKFLSDERTRCLVRDFIVENRIVRQTQENWHLIRNKFDLSDTEEDGVFRKY